MDALEVLMNVDKIVPFFQPIVNADRQRIIGYEVLGRIEMNGELVSLGPFFSDKGIPDEYLLEVDEIIQHKAFQYYCEKNENLMLFLNVNINIFLADYQHCEAFLARVKSYESAGLKLSNIVIELKEHDYDGDVSRLRHLITYFQSLGLQVAIDDVGRGGSNLDRIAQLEPDILKVDLTFIKGEEISQVHKDVLYSLAMFARKTGATLLFEGIGDVGKLHNAWRHGGGYYQGFYLAKPMPTFVDRNSCKETIIAQFQHFITYERNKLSYRYTFTDELNRRLESITKKDKRFTGDDSLQQFAKVFEDICFRIYICDQYGFQRSSNYVRIEDQSWIFQHEFLGKNWSWRPYFLENIVRMQFEKRGILSDLYRDIEKDEFIRTFSYPITEELYLFADISYEYLFEKEGLL